MSIIKFINGKNRGNQSLKDAISYVTDPEKTTDEYIDVNGIDPEYAYQDMIAMQRFYGQDEGRRFVHYILSFDKGVSKDEAWEICQEAASYYGEDFQYIMAVHCNTANLHMHVVLNAVNVRTGRKFSQSKGELQKFKDCVNSILERYGLNPVNDISEGDWPDDWELTQINTYPGEPIDYLGDFLIECDEEIYSYGNYENDKSYEDDYDVFGSYEEEEMIADAEQQDSVVKSVIAYFEGKTDVLPDGIDYYEAESMYQQWQESQNYFEEY